MALKIADTKEILVLLPIIVVVGVIYFYLYQNGYIDKKKDITEQILGQKKVEFVKEKVEGIKGKTSSFTDEVKKKYYKTEKKAINIMEIKEGEKYTTKSGLEFEVLTLGNGKKPTINNEVEVHYHGTLLDGSVFDSSVQRGQTISFPLSGVIAGWQEGLQYMPVGSKFKFTIPPELAYGNRAAGSIPPNSTLIFEVELFEVK